VLVVHPLSIVQSGEGSPQARSYQLVRVFTAGIEPAALLLAGVGILAALLAAARVVTSDPAAALRSE